MKYFWVNQGGTYTDEVQIGCLWAPQFDAKGQRLTHWDSMDELVPGDIVFNYANGRLHGYTIVLSAAAPASRPYSSGSPYSPSQGGRIVFCDYEQLLPPNQIPLANLVADNTLKADLSSGHNPVMNSAGKIAQKYLCRIASAVGQVLMNKLVALGLPLAAGLETQQLITKTTVKQLIDARVGQGKFRDDLLVSFCGACPITGLKRTELLRASHIKAWSKSAINERLDPENGLLLAAGIDAAFDKGLVSFDSNGALLTHLTNNEMFALGIPAKASLHQQHLTPARVAFLQQHRNASGF